MSAANPAAFTRRGGFALVAGGFALFVLMLYLMGSGESLSPERETGQAHAASNGLNGYSGLVRLVEAEGYTVERSRTGAGLETDGLLVLAPSPYANPEDLAAILANRTLRGPTLVLVSKWLAMPPTERLPQEARERFRRGWVILGGPVTSGWTTGLPQPYRFGHKFAEGTGGATATQWRGMGYAGVLPTAVTLHAEPAARHDVLIADAAGRTLAFAVTAGGAMAEDAYPVIVLAEPDLANNYGLADPARAAAAMALVDRAIDGGDVESVTFDLTLNGFGASENLLTLAFRPPFLAATLSLLAALLIVGWRAFRRFGPPASASGPAIAFGKHQLIANGAGLILRARCFRLLAKPYAALSARRLAERLGLPRPEPAAIDAALARRLPAEEPFTTRAARLEAAQRPADILAAARALDDLHARLSHSPTQQGQ